MFRTSHVRILTNFAQDSDTNNNTTESSIAGDGQLVDGRKRRSEAFQLRKSMFGKKHDRLGESKVSNQGYPNYPDVALLEQR